MVVPVVVDPVTRIVRHLEERIGARRFQLWFKNTARLTLDDQNLSVEVPNDFVGGWIENHFMEHLREAALKATGSTPKLSFKTNPNLITAETSAPRRVGDAAPAPLSTRRPYGPAGIAHSRRKLRYTLDKFIVGSSNQLAYSAVQCVVDHVISRYNPLFLHGGCGLGKTHLLQGLCNALSAKDLQIGWSYVSGEEFTNQFIVAMKTGSLDAFRRQYRNVDVLVIDDVHFLANKRATQEEFLHTYNAINAAGKQVVMASDAHPRLIGQLSGSLVDRFISGMVVQIDPPDPATRTKIIEMRSEELGARLARPIVELLAHSIQGNVREIEGALLKLAAYSSLCNQPVDMQMADKVIREYVRPQNGMLQVSQIELKVAEYFGVKVSDIRCSKRTRDIALARAVAMYLARRHTHMSFPEIGKYMGNKNHSTVILACKKIEQLLELNQEVAWKGGNGCKALKLARVIGEIEGALGCARPGEPG